MPKSAWATNTSKVPDRFMIKRSSLPILKHPKYRKKTISMPWMALAAGLTLALLPVGCSLQSTSADKLDDLMAQQNTPYNKVRNLLMSMEDPLGYITNRINSPDYQTSVQGMKVLVYGLGMERSEKGKALIRGTLPSLIDCFSSTNLPTRSRALWMIGELGSDAAPAVDALVPIARNSKPPEDKKFITRLAAIRSLGRIGAYPEQCLPVLMELMEDPDPEVRRFAVVAVGKFGEEAAPARPLLEKMAGGKKEKLAKAATRALEKMDLIHPSQ